MIFSAKIEEGMDYDTLRKIASMESFSVDGSKLLAVFSSLMPKAADVFSGIVSNILPTPGDNEFRLTNSRYKKISAAVADLPYSSYREMKIMVPEGFAGDLKEYGKVLLDLRSASVAIAEDSLNNMVYALQLFLTNAEIRTSIELDSREIKKLAKEQDRIETMISRYFARNSVSTRASFGAVTQRFSDINDIFSVGEKLEGLKTNNDTTSLLSQVSQLVELFADIHRKIDEGTIDKLSSEAAKKISDMAFQTAKFLELTSSIIFNAQVYVAVADSLATQLEKVTAVK